MFAITIKNSVRRGTTHAVVYMNTFRILPNIMATISGLISGMMIMSDARAPIAASIMVTITQRNVFTGFFLLKGSSLA